MITFYRRLGYSISLFSILLFASLGCTTTYSAVDINGLVTDAISGLPIEGFRLSVEPDRCGLTGLSNCEIIDYEKESLESGHFFMYFGLDCSNDLHCSLSPALKDIYPEYRLYIRNTNGKPVPKSCHDNIVVNPGTAMSLDISVQPIMHIVIKPLNTNSVELVGLQIPEFNIESGGIIDAGMSHILEISKYQGEIEIILNYSSGLEKRQWVDYDYHSNTTINIEVEN